VGRFRLLALDIDGTLLDTGKRISPRNAAAVAAARAAGVRLVLVTGRRLPAARRIADQLGPAIPLVLHNGALILEDDEVLRCQPLPRAVAAEAVRVGRAAGADPVLHCGHVGEGLLRVEGVARSNTLLAYYLDKSHPDVEVVPDPIQVMFGGAIEEMAATHAALRAALGPRALIERTLYPAQGVSILDVLHPRVGKAVALAFLQRRWKLRPDETLAIGDNWNDREMLERAGLGLVMGNADPEMLALGLPVLPSNDADGVAVAIETHLLGPAGGHEKRG
jgi:Cof subfamily protein (haloacid dehalogenase superfamily)